MNKNDIKLIIVILVIVGILILIINLNKKEGDTVEVYYKDDLVLSADLSINNTVEGLLGNVVIEVKDKKVRVVKENSPKNICSKEGYISDSTKPLICLPNKVVIKIVQSSDMDGVVY